MPGTYSPSIGIDVGWAASHLQSLAHPDCQVVKTAGCFSLVPKRWEGVDASEPDQSPWNVRHQIGVAIAKVKGALDIDSMAASGTVNLVNEALALHLTAVLENR